MAKTLVEVQQQIAELRAIEDELRRSEAQGVISRIREAISVYGLTPSDLFGSPSKSSQSAGRVMSQSAAVKFCDAAGNTWSGRGPRPKWVRDAIASGKSLDQLAVGDIGGPKSKAKAPVAGTYGKASIESVKSARKAPIKFRDGENAWSGRGSQPRWLKEALASGKSLKDFEV